MNITFGSCEEGGTRGSTPRPLPPEERGTMVLTTDQPLGIAETYSKHGYDDDAHLN